jgi:hypothetical protein
VGTLLQEPLREEGSESSRVFLDLDRTKLVSLHLFPAFRRDHTAMEMEHVAGSGLEIGIGRDRHLTTAP